MNWQKIRGISSLFALSIILTACQSSRLPTGLEIWNKILWFGTLGFIGFNDNPVAGFMRILVGILIFAILFELSRVVGLSRNIGITVSIILSLMTAVFIPGTVLAGIGTAYATFVSFVLIGLPVVGGLYALYRIPSTSRWWIFIKIVLILILIAILISVKDHALALSAIGGQTIG